MEPKFIYYDKINNKIYVDAKDLDRKQSKNTVLFSLSNTYQHSKFNFVSVADVVISNKKLISYTRLNECLQNTNVANMMSIEQIHITQELIQTMHKISQGIITLTEYGDELMLQYYPKLF